MGRLENRMKRKMEQNPIVECNKIQNKYLPNLFKWFDKVADPRHQGYITYRGVKKTLVYELKNDIMIIKISSLQFNTIDAFLDYYIPSKKIRYLLFQNQWIKIDGRSIHRNESLVGENLEIKIYPSSIDTRLNETCKLEIEIVYEDPFIVIANKPPGLLVHNDGDANTNLQEMLDSYYAQQWYKFCHHLYTITELFMKDDIYKMEQPDLIIYDSAALWGRYISKYFGIKSIASCTPYTYPEQYALSDLNRFSRMIFQDDLTVPQVKRLIYVHCLSR